MPAVDSSRPSLATANERVKLCFVISPKPLDGVIIVRVHLWRLCVHCRMHSPAAIFCHLLATRVAAPRLSTHSSVHPLLLARSIRQQLAPAAVTVGADRVRTVLSELRTQPPASAWQLSHACTTMT